MYDSHQSVASHVFSQVHACKSEIDESGGTVHVYLGVWGHVADNL